MSYEIQFMIDAEKDLNAIYDYIADNDSLVNAEKFIDKLIQKCLSLNRFPIEVIGWLN
jgi:plasmid stabilization system protein ParE